MSFKSSLWKNFRLPWYPRRFVSSYEIEQNAITANYVSNLSQTLGCSAGTAGLLLTRNKKILNSDFNNIQKVALFCRSNFRLSEVIELPEVLSLPPYVLKDRTCTLRELGCCTVTAGNVLFFKHFIQQTPVDLHRNGFQMNPNAYFTHAVKQLKCPDDVKLRLMSKLLDLHSKNFTLSEMKALINATYLAWKLEFSEEKMMSALHRYSSLCTKSLVSLESVYDMLLQKFRLPRSKVYGSLHLLALDHDNLEELLLKVPSLCGVSLQHVARKQPSILRRPVNSLIDVLHVLEDHSVTAVQLLLCPKILNFSASRILSRLDALKNSENYEIWREDERFLWLVFHFGGVSKNSKLENHKADMPSNYKKLHLYSNGYSNFSDVCFYLAIVFGNSVEEVKKELKQYRRIYTTTLGNVQNVVEYLTAQGITKEQLWNGLGIVSYSAEVVREFFMMISDREDLQPSFEEWIGHHNIIQLLIYEIEKEQSFGDGDVCTRSGDKTRESIEIEELLLHEEEKSVICTVNGDSDYVYNVNDL